jgi:hypothetical protein
VHKPTARSPNPINSAMFAHVSLQRCSIAACSSPAALTRPQVPRAAATAAAVVRPWQQQPEYKLVSSQCKYGTTAPLQTGLRGCSDVSCFSGCCAVRHRQKGLLLPQPQPQQHQQQRCTATAAGEAPTSISSIYDRPQLYDEAFSYRDFVTEVSSSWQADSSLHPLAWQQTQNTLPGVCKPSPVGGQPSNQSMGVGP